MSKFIRLTFREDGSADYHNTACILGFEKSEDGGSLVRFADTYHYYTETPEQILSLIGGDDLKERVAFLEKALDQAIQECGLNILEDILCDGPHMLCETKRAPELSAYMKEPKAVKS